MTRPEQSKPLAKKLTMRALCERYDVTDRTIDRWLETGILPQPMRINRVRYWDETDIEAFERSRMAAQDSKTAA